MRIQWLTCTGKVRWRFVVHKTFPELHRRTEVWGLDVIYTPDVRSRSGIHCWPGAKHRSWSEDRLSTVDHIFTLSCLGLGQRRLSFKPNRFSEALTLRKRCKLRLQTIWDLGASRYWDYAGRAVRNHLGVFWLFGRLLVKRPPDEFINKRYTRPNMCVINTIPILHFFLLSWISQYSDTPRLDFQYSDELFPEKIK